MAARAISWRKTYTVYLIHFARPFKHARHYIGSTVLPLGDRIARHHTNNGAALLRAVNRAGIPWRVVRVWKRVPIGTERKLKQRSGTERKRWCPVCSGPSAHQRGKV